jgi:starch-binding outer membrane protein, SusD/RagB family
MKKIHILVAFFTVFAVFSCRDSFIDLTPPTALPPEKYYKTEADLKSAVSGIYGLLRNVYANYHLLNELPSDNTHSYGESEAGTGAFDKLNWLPTTGDLSGQWNVHYNTIAQCNNVIEKIDGVTFAREATKAQYIAEAKFARALMYFNLVRYFGDVPLVLKVLRTEEEGYTYLRTPVAAVYTQIEKDLQDAESVLPALYTDATDRGRASNGAAKALLGKVYLQQNKYALAEAKLKEVRVQSPANYDLLPGSNYADVFSINNEYNKEIIFTVSYSRATSGVGEGSGFAYLFLPQPSGRTIVTNIAPSSINIGTSDLFDAFEPGDIRRNMITLFTQTFPYYYTRKFLDNPPAVNEGENNWIVIRYADVLLMLAESLNEQGKTTEALTTLQLVRTRAGLTTNLALNQTDTRRLIKNERRVELCYEGHRWQDLIRWNDYETVMRAYKLKYSINGAASINITPERRLFPIPLRERVLNQNLTQNPGY